MNMYQSLLNFCRQTTFLTLIVLVSQHLATQHSAEAEQVPPGLTIQSVSVWPERVELTRPWHVAQILITGHLEDGQTVDLTRAAQSLTQTDLVNVSEHRQVTPRSDGELILQFEAVGQTLEVPVSVSGMSAGHVASFVQDVAPSLSKMGCNSGTCHGSKDGQRGFKLSLRGYDFLFDHRALTDDIGARRFNRANPDQSLMLLKATGSIPHVGGQLTQPGKRRYELLRAWIQRGASLNLDAPRVTGIRLVPENPIVPRNQMKQQVVVLATYSDGTERDVTADAFIESGNIDVLSASDDGIVTALRRGEAAVLARFEGAYAATTVTIMGDRTGFVWQQPESYNYVDRLVYDKLQRVKIEPASLCTDAEFLRRVHLDLTGLPPRAEDVREFLASDLPSRQKREELIDQLIGSAAYVEHWTNKWSDLLQVNRKFIGEEGAASLRTWIQEAIASNRAYDEFAYQILTASGSTAENPAAAYWKILRDPALAMENTTHLFLAVRFNCNKCHDHPFERWTQDQYYQMTAYFAQIGRKEDPLFSGAKIGGSAVEKAQPLVEVVFDSGQGESIHDRTGEITAPAFPYDGRLAELTDEPRRQTLAKWITSPDNRYFASSYVNRLWGYLLGVGLIEPIDDIRAGNPPTNPELLQALTEDFVSSGFNVQHMLRQICSSRVYQHSVATTRWNEDDEINYSHALPRRLPAEVLYDAIHRVTGASSRIPGLPVGLRAAQLPDAGISLPFLDDFGRPPRESSCECERSSGIVLGPVMKLINGPTVNDALVDPQNELAKLTSRIDDDAKLVEEIFLRVLSRSPTSYELEMGIQSLQTPAGDADQAKQMLAEYRQQRLAKMQDWLDAIPSPATWQVIDTSSATADAASLKVVDGDVIAVEGERKKDRYVVVGKVDDRFAKLTGLQLETLPDDSLPQGGPGRADNGNFVLSEITLEVRHSEDAEWQSVKLDKPNASFSQDGWAVSGAVDGNPATGWGISPRFKQLHVASFVLADPLDVTPETQCRVVLHHQHDDLHSLGRFRISTTDSPSPFMGSQLPDAVQKIVALDPSERSDEQSAKLEAYFLGLDADYVSLEQVAKVSSEQAKHHRLTGVQDLAWALINTPAFLFNR